MPEQIEQPVLRFAPSPTGYLHLGHAYSVLTCIEYTQRLGGRLLLRIEDTDLNRCRQEYIDAILEDLDWLVGGLHKIFDPNIRRQSEHLGDYERAIDKLHEKGVLYRCAASRSQIAADAGENPTRDPDGAIVFRGRGAYPPQENEPFSVRLDIGRALHELGFDPKGNPLTFLSLTGDELEVQRCEPDLWGDVILVGKDRPASYHLAVVVDDALQGITHVVRGEDLKPSTSVHRVLQELLNLPAPIYHHHGLIVPENRETKLSKSHSDQSLRSLRRAGSTPADIMQAVGIQAIMAAPPASLQTNQE